MEKRTHGAVAEMAEWKCEPCGHEAGGQPGEVCLICRTPIAAVKVVAEGGRIKQLRLADGVEKQGSP